MSEPTYPLTLPSSPNPRSMSISLERRIAGFENPFTYALQTFEHQGKRWKVRMSMPPMTQEQADDWEVLLLQLRGILGTFYLTPYDRPSSLGNPSGSPTLTSIHSSKTQVVIGNCTPSITGYLKKGDWISFANNLLVKLTADVDTDGSGNATLDFEPALRSDPSLSSAITYTNPRGVFRLTSSLSEWNINALKHYGFTFDFVEAIS